MKDDAGRKFISIRWKIFILLVVVLVGVQGMYAFFSLAQLDEQFHLQREQINQSEVARLEGSVEASYQRLLEVAELLPLIESPQGDLSPLEQLKKMISLKFDAFQLTGSVNAAYLYDNQAQVVGFWGERVAIRQEDIQQVYDTERPLRKLVCDTACLRYVAIPIQMAGEKQGVLVVGRFLYDVIYDIKQQSRLDIGLVLQAPAGVGELSHWGLLINSLTNRSLNQELLEKLSLRQSFDPEGRSYILEHNDRHFEILFSPLKGVGEGRAYWVVLDDISGHLLNIRQSLLNYLLLGVGGILTVLLLLSMLLGKPIQFFTRLAQEMSLLSQGEFCEFRRNLAQFQHRHSVFGEDERDLLFRSAMALSRQLEQLKEEIAERTDSLEKSRQALTQERDFLCGLLNTAPLIIMTQTSQGQLRSVNHYGLQLMGLDERSFRKTTFMKALQREEERRDFLSNTTRLLEGLEAEVRTDSILLDGDGNRHDLSWLHVRLRKYSDEPLILSIGIDISERKLAERRLQWLVNHDPLTERPNRLLFLSCLNDAVEKSRGQDEHVAVLFIDLDRFKEVNDSLGHGVGDKLLKVATRRISSCIRDSDVLARQGGDEFSVLLTRIRDLEGAEVIASQLLQAFQQPFLIGEYEIVVTVSIGISLFPDHGDDGASLIKHAGIAMFQAKNSGKNCYYIYDVEKDHQRFERFSLGADLRKAIQNDELVLYYQPQVDTRTGRVVGVEALVRWQHPAAGLLSPDRFIPLAEELDLIIPLGEWVLREACRQMQAWRHIGLPEMKVSVNLAGQQIAHERLINSVEEALTESGLSPQYLELEVTESFVIRQPEVAVGKLTYLRERGITLAMDDFGTGYSSLSYLKKLPIDRLKIDRSFVKDIGIDRSDESIIKATLAMCQALGLEVVAEGVESSEQLNFLKENNCHIIQGYYFSKPLLPEVFMQYICNAQQLTDP